MGYFEISAIVSAVFNCALAFMMMRGRFRSKLHLAHLCWGIELTIWNGCAAVTLHQTNAGAALFWAKMLEVGIIFLPISMLHVCLLMTDSKPKRWIPALYTVHGLLALSLPTNLYIRAVRLTPFGYWGLAGPLFHVYGVLYTIETSWFMYLLWQQRRRVPGTQKRGITAMMVGLFVLVLGGANDLLPLTGMTYYPHTHLHLFPMANIAANLYAMMISYHILQYELMEIHITMSRVAAQIVRMGFVFMIALVLLLITWAISPSSFSDFSFTMALIIVIISTSSASVLFPRLFGMDGSINLERRILGDRFESDSRVCEFIASVQQSGDAEEMLKGLEAILLSVVRVTGYRVYMMDDVTQKFVVLQATPHGSESTVTISTADSPLVTFFRESGEDYLAARLSSHNPLMAAYENEARRVLEAANFELCFPFMGSSEPFGFLLLKERVDGRRYTASDVDLLSRMSKNLSLALNHIRLKQQISQTQEAEFLGRISRGMAHDLNNLCTPVRTLMELMSDRSISIESLRDELLPIAQQNMDTVREYIQSSLFFSEHSHGNFQPSDMSLTVEEVVTLLRDRCQQRRIQVHVKDVTDIHVEMDGSLIKRTISNILSNAIDASSDGSQITLKISRFKDAQTLIEWARVEIIDEGTGISPKNLKKIFTPYFTTKNRGDNKRGFGLGLAICRKIVQMHHGQLQISSTLGKGTTVSIVLPVVQPLANSVIPGVPKHDAALPKADGTAMATAPQPYAAKTDGTQPGWGALPFPKSEARHVLSLSEPETADDAGSAAPKTHTVSA